MMRLLLASVATLLATSVMACSALASSSSPPSKMQLKYFNARGAAETARILLAIGGEDYEDVRYDITPGTMDSPAFKAAKESGELRMNLNRAPVLVAPDGTVIGQSKSIERYLARRFGLMGSDGTPEQEAVVDCVAEHCRDVRDAAMRKGFSAFARGKTDEEKAAAREEWFSEDMPAMLGKIDGVLAETGSSLGFAVGSSTTLADVAIWSLLRDCYPPDADDTARAAEKCETLLAIADAVGSNPSVAKWLEERPASNF